MYEIFTFLSIISLVSSLNCRLYGIDQSSIETKFVFMKNASSYESILNLGKTVFSGGATSTKIDNEKYISTYHTFDSLGIPHFFLIIINIETKSIELNLTLIEKHDSGSFWQIAMTNTSEVLGIRDSFQSGSNLEVAAINRTTGLMKTIGTYPIGSFSIVMSYATKRRLYYNIIDSTLYGLNIDTGKLAVNIRIPSDYVVYAIDYDANRDRLISLVYSNSVGNGWILAEIIVTDRKEIKFNRIGETMIPFEKYLWSTTYTLDDKERLWITLWTMKDDRKSIFIIFNVDSGKIIETHENDFNDITNLVCFS